MEHSYLLCSTVTLFLDESDELRETLKLNNLHDMPLSGEANVGVIVGLYTEEKVFIGDTFLFNKFIKEEDANLRSFIEALSVGDHVELNI